MMTSLKILPIIGIMMSTSFGLAIEIQPGSALPITHFFHPIENIKGHFEYESRGAALVDNLGKKKSAYFEWKNGQRVLKKAYLIWGSEIKSKDIGNAKKIILTLPSNQTKYIHANFFWKISDPTIKANDTVAYSGITDVTHDFKKQNGKFSVSLSHDGRMGGFSLIAIYEKKGGPKRHIIILGGVARLKPGEVYEVDIEKKDVVGEVSRITTIGGDGKAGNGSANSLNGLTLSGKDDWDGSSGYLWDVDDYNIGQFKISAQKGLTWTIDPLLQWLYPMGIVVQVDIKE